MPKKSKSAVDETKTRGRIVPEAPDEIDLPTSPPLAEELPPTAPVETPPEPELILSSDFAPALVGKVVGDDVMLTVDANITSIAGNEYTLSIVEVAEAEPALEMQEGVEAGVGGELGGLVSELKKPKV